MKRRLFTKVLVTTAAAVALSLGVFGGHKALAAQDCTANSIIYCGATTPGDFINKAKQNKTGDLPAIFQNFGLVPADYARFAQTARTGVAYKDGRIVVDGRVVATNAWSIGRNHNTYTRNYPIAGHMYYASNNQDVFLSNSIPVMVMFDSKGVMQFAVLTACSNPITGNKVVPNYACNQLQKTPVAGKANTYSFTTKATAANGANLVKAVYDFGDNTPSVTVNNLATPVTHTYAKPGTYTTRVTVYVSLPGNQQTTVTSATCATLITVPQPPTTPPTTPPEQPPVCEYNHNLPANSPDCAVCQYNAQLPANSPDCQAPQTPETPQTPATPSTLPNTGAGDLLGIFGGTSLLGGVGYHVRRKFFRG